MSRHPSLRALSRAEFSVAQFGLAIALLSDVLAVFAGAWSGLVPGTGVWASVALAVFALLGVWARALSGRYSEAANTILMKLDLEDGLGRIITAADRADILDDAPFLVRRIAKRVREQPYFESALDVSPARLIENLRESAWWTKRLAGDMAWATHAFFMALVGTGALILVASLASGGGTPSGSTAGTYLSALLLFIISQSPHQASGRYAALRDAADKVQQRADVLLQSGVSELEAVELAAEYHRARQVAPVIPTLWYRYRQDGLNETWRETMGQAAAPTLQP